MYSTSMGLSLGETKVSEAQSFVSLSNRLRGRHFD
jgi:hypothetical protein